MKNIYNYFKEINKLNETIRTGWINRKIPLNRLESVGEHTFTTALLALATIDKYGLKLNVEKVLKMILIHDLGEIDVGDIALPNEEQAKKKYVDESNCVNRVCEVLNEEWMFDLWKEFEEKQTEESIFVYKMDKLQSVMQARYYSELINDSNKTFKDFYDHEVHKFKEFKEIVEE